MGTAIGTKLAPTYTCIFMDKVETSFLETQEMKPLVWFRYTDDLFWFFILSHGQEQFDYFLQNLIDVTPILNLHVSQVKRVFHFLILK